MLQPPHQLSPPDIEVRIEGPNSGYGEITVQQTYFNKSNKQTSDNSASLVYRSNESLHNIPINYRVMSGYIRVSYIPQIPGVHKLSVTMHSEHVSESPYLITVDKKVENVTGQLSNRTPIARDVSGIQKEGRRPKVLLRIVDFVTEKMLLTEDGKLKKLPSGNMVTRSRIPRHVAVEISGHKAENGDISDIDTNNRAGSSVTMSPRNSDTSLALPQRHILKRRDLNFFRDRCKKVILLCRFFVKRNPSHNSFQILHSAEQFLDGRPVRLTDKTFKLIESGLKSIKQKTNDDNSDENTETRISDRDVLKTDRNLGSSCLTDKCEQMFMTCECITIFPHKTLENRSHMSTEMINFNKLNPVERDLSRVQHKEKTRHTRLKTDVMVGDNSGYDLNFTESSTICYDVDHSPKHEVCDANNLNEGTEANGTRAKNVVSSSRGAQYAKIWGAGLSMGTPSQEISTSLVPFTQQYTSLNLETMSTVKFPDKQTQKEHAVLIPETTDIEVTAHELRVDQVNCLIFTPLYFGASQQNIIKSLPERQCLTETENRRNAIVCEGSDVLTLIDNDVPFASVCKQEATFISAKKGMDVTSCLPSPFVQEFGNYQGNKNETNVRLNHVRRTENENERVNSSKCHTTASAPATGTEYNDTECKTNAHAGRNFKSKEICSTRDTRRHLQSAKHPAQVISAYEYSELQTEDEANYEKYWEGKNDESIIDIIWSTKNDSIKVTEIFMNENIPSDDEKNHMNSQTGQTIGAQLVGMSSNINISVTETEDEDTVFGRHIRQKPAEDLQTDDLVNITSSFWAGNRNVYTLLPQMVQEPREDISLQVDTEWEQRGAACTSLLAGNTFEYKRRAEHASVCNPSRTDSCHTSNVFQDLEDKLSQISTTHMTSSSNDVLEHLFHLRSPDTRFESSPGVTAGLYDENALDSDSVLADPNLEETVHKLDKMLRVIKERDTSDNAYKLRDVSVSTEEEAVSLSPEPCSNEGSSMADDIKVQLCIKGYGEVMRDSPKSEFRNISEPTASKNYRKQNIFQFSVKKQRKQELLGNTNAAVSRFKCPANKETWGVTADEIKYDTGRDGNGRSLYADLTSDLVQMRHCSRTLPERAPIMTSTEEENKGNDITDRYTGLNVHLQNNSESSGKFSRISVSSPLVIPEKEDEEAEEAKNIEDFAEEFKPPNIIILEKNFIDIKTLKNIVIINGMVLQSESNSCASSKIEYSGPTAKEITCISAITDDMTTLRAEPILDRNGNLGNIKKSPTCTVKRQARRRYFTRDHQSDKLYYNKAQVKNRQESLAQNTEYSNNYADYAIPDIVMQLAAAPGANILQKNKTNILEPFKLHDYISEMSKSIRLEPSSNVGANSTVDKNTKISESQREQSPLPAFVNTADIKRISNSYSQSQMAENNITDNSSLLLPGFLIPMRENTLQAPIQHSERVKETDNNEIASSVSNLLYNAENSNVKFHRENEDPNRSRRIITDRKITHEITKNMTSRRHQKFSGVDNKVVSITSNGNIAVNEQTHLSETEKSYTKLGGLTNQKIHELCNKVFPSHTNRRISPSLLPNINIDFRGSSELFQENETVNIHKRVLISQKRNETPAGKPETKLSLTKYSALQCEQFMFSSTCNRNEISPLEERTITARDPVTHSSQRDRVAYSMPQTAGDTSLAISLPQPGVITTDMDILHPLVTKKTDPKGSVGETRHDNKLSNKTDENFGITTKKVRESKERVVCGTEYFMSQVPIRNDVRIPNEILHQVVATKYYTDVAHKRKDNYVRRREIETKVPAIINTNIYTLDTYENSVNDERVNNNCKRTDQENERLKKSMEYKVPDKMQNDVVITELKTIQDIVRNYLMKHRPNVQDLLTSDSINRFPECMQLTQKKEHLDKKWMKQSDWQDKQVKINDRYDYNKYPQCFTGNRNQWSTNRRLTPVYKTEKVNTWRQAFPSSIICNKNAVADRSDLVRSQKTVNKYLMYKNINISRQELLQISGLMITGRTELEGKGNIYINQKDIVLQVNDGGFTSVGKIQNRQVFEHYIQTYRYSPAVTSANFITTTSSILSSNTALFKQSQTDLDDEVDSCYRTANNSIQNEQQNEKLPNGTANKQLQILKEENTSTVPMKTENCDLNTTKFEELVGTGNEIYRAKLVHITDDGYIVPTLQTLLLMPGQKNSIIRKSFQGGSQNRTGFSPEQYGKGGSVYINHDNSDLHQLVYSKEMEKYCRGLMSKKDVKTESRLRFQRAKLFFQKFQQNTLE